MDRKYGLDHNPVTTLTNPKLGREAEIQKFK